MRTPYAGQASATEADEFKKSSPSFCLNAFVDDVVALVETHSGWLFSIDIQHSAEARVRGDCVAQPASAAAARTSTRMAIRLRVCGVDDTRMLPRVIGRVASWLNRTLHIVGGR